MALAYPLAYLRGCARWWKGGGAVDAQRGRRPQCASACNGVRPPVRRAVFHFIGQTFFRVPRYRIYLVLYGGVGLSVVAATVLRFAM